MSAIIWRAWRRKGEIAFALDHEGVAFAGLVVELHVARLEVLHERGRLAFEALGRADQVETFIEKRLALLFEELGVEGGLGRFGRLGRFRRLHDAAFLTAAFAGAATFFGRSRWLWLQPSRAAQPSWRRGPAAGPRSVESLVGTAFVTTPFFGRGGLGGRLLRRRRGFTHRLFRRGLACLVAISVPS